MGLLACHCSGTGVAGRVDPSIQVYKSSKLTQYKNSNKCHNDVKMDSNFTTFIRNGDFARNGIASSGSKSNSLGNLVTRGIILFYNKKLLK